MKKFMLLIICMIISGLSFSQSNMIDKTNSQVKDLVIKEYQLSNDEPLNMSGGDKYAYIYITKDGKKITFHFNSNNNKCVYQKIEYPSVDEGKKIIEILNEKFVKSSDNVWIENNKYEWIIVLYDNKSILTIKPL